MASNTVGVEKKFIKETIEMDTNDASCVPDYLDEALVEVMRQPIL